MITYLLLALGGVAGALTRYHVGRYVQARTATIVPLGTCVINLSGSLLLGLVTGWFVHDVSWPDGALRLLLGTGFCGAYTTFSSFAFESSQLWRAGRRRWAVLNLLGEPLLGALAAWVGLWLSS